MEERDPFIPLHTNLSDSVFIIALFLSPALPDSLTLALFRSRSTLPWQRECFALRKKPLKHYTDIEPCAVDGSQRLIYTHPASTFLATTLFIDVLRPFIYIIPSVQCSYIRIFRFSFYAVSDGVDRMMLGRLVVRMLSTHITRTNTRHALAWHCISRVRCPSAKILERVALTLKI